MIGYLDGIWKAPNIICTSSGVGYDVFYTNGKQLKENDPVCVWIAEIIREDAHDLYGFSTLEEKELFTLIRKVNRVGPKITFHILEHLGFIETINALVGQDTKKLATTPGVGIAKAKTIIDNITLPAYLADLSEDDVTVHVNQKRNDLIEALISFGYDENKIKDATQNLDWQEDESVLLAHLLGVLNGGANA